MKKTIEIVPAYTAIEQMLELAEKKMGMKRPDDEQNAILDAIEREGFIEGDCRYTIFYTLEVYRILKKHFGISYTMVSEMVPVRHHNRYLLTSKKYFYIGGED